MRPAPRSPHGVDFLAPGQAGGGEKAVLRRAWRAYLEDAVITGKVRIALSNTPLGDATIRVQTFDGVLHLGGLVGARSSVEIAMAATEGVAGVRWVRSQLRVEKQAIR